MSSQCEIYKGRQCSCGKHHCRTSLVGQIRATAAMMQDTGAAMEYYGGFNSETAEKGREMIGAASIADAWADYIEGGMLTESDDLPVIPIEDRVRGGEYNSNKKGA